MNLVPPCGVCGRVHWGGEGCPDEVTVTRGWSRSLVGPVTGTLVALTFHAVAFIGGGGGIGAVFSGGPLQQQAPASQVVDDQQSSGDWSFNYLDTVYNMTVLDTQDFALAADTNSGGWGQFAGDIDGPGPGGTGVALELLTGTTPTGDDAYARQLWTDVADQWAPRYFEYTNRSADTILAAGCIMRISFPSMNTSGASAIKGTGLGGNNDVWWGFRPPEFQPRAAGQDTLIRGMAFAGNDVAGWPGTVTGFYNLPPHIAGLAQSDTLVFNGSGTSDPGDWFKLEMLLVETNGKVVTHLDGVMLAHSDSSSADWIHDLPTDTSIVAPSSFQNKTVWKIPGTTNGGGSGMGTLTENDFIDVDRCVIYGLGA